MSEWVWSVCLGVWFYTLMLTLVHSIMVHELFNLLVGPPGMETCGVLCLKSQLSDLSNIGIWSQDLWTVVILREGSG